MKQPRADIKIEKKSSAKGAKTSIARPGNNIAIKNNIKSAIALTQEDVWYKRFMLLSAATGQITYIYDIKSGNVSWFGEIKKILGYSQKELSGGVKQWKDLVHPLDVVKAVKLLKIAERNCSTYETIYRFKTRKRKYITISEKGFFIPGENGKACQMVGQLTDITEKVNRDEIIKKKEEDFLSIIDEMPHFVYRIGLNGKITFANRAYRNSFGLKTNEILGKTAYDLHPREMADKYFADDKKVFKSKKTFYTIEENINKITGRKEIVEVFKIPLRNETGKVIGLQGVFWSITDRIAIQKALKSIESDYQEIFNSTGEAIIIHDAVTGKILEVNEIASAMYGHSKEEFLALTINDISSGDANFDKKHALMYITRLNEKKTFTMEWMAKKKNGSLFWAEVSLRKSRIGGKGKVLAVIRDISKRKEDEKALFLSQVSINTSHDAVIWFNKAGRVLYVNNTAFGMLRYSKKEIYSLSISDIENNSDSQYWQQRIDLLNKKGSINLETVFKDKKGVLIPVEISASFYKYEKDEFVFFVVRDITERKQAEEKLRESEKKFRDMTELLPQGVFECTPAGMVTYANKIMFELLQRTSEDLERGFHVIDSIAADERLQAGVNIKAILEGRAKSYQQYNMLRKDGLTFPVSIYTGLIKKEGNIVGLRGVIVDQTELAALEKEKKEKENLFSLLFEKAGDANLLIRDNRFIDCNETTVVMLKAESKETIISAHPWEISPEFQPDGRKSSEKALQNIETAYSEGNCRFEWVHRRFDGTLFFAEVVLTAVPINGIWHLHTSWRDITDKKNAEEKEKIYYQRLEKLLEIERKILSAQSTEAVSKAALNHLRITLDCHRASVILFDKEDDSFKVIALDTSINTGLKEGNVYSLSQSAFANPGNEEYYLINDMSLEENLSDLDSELKKEGVLSRLLIPITINNETAGSLSLSSTIRNNFNDENIKIAQDVAVSLSLALQHSKFVAQINKHNLELEKRVDERTSQLRQTISELESFSYSVSHDLRAPLRSIGGFSQAIIDDYSDKFDEEGNLLFQRIISATQRMSDLIDALLLLARITRSEMCVEKIDFSEMVSLTVNDIVRQNEERPNVTFIIQPGLFVRGDQKLLRIAVENLLNNAWKFTKNEEAAVIEFGQTAINGQETFYIKDNGVGLDMAYSGKLFGAFQRLHNKDEFEGTGIGLATTKRIIQRHNGSIWVESKINEGAVFYFNIPD